jgi:hypothetical protein
MAAPARVEPVRVEPARVEPARVEDDGNGRRERIPEQRKRDMDAAFDDLAPLELNLDEEPKEQGKSRRFLRRK